MNAEPGPRAVLPSCQRWALHDVAATRRIEQAAMAGCPQNVLMERAGLAVARLAAAVAPRTGKVWVASGPGNNGGDGLVAGAWLQRWGRAVQVSLLADADALPADASQALQLARDAGVSIAAALPDRIDAGLGIDALLGIGANRPPRGVIAEAIARLNGNSSTVLAVDLPSGLGADTGMVLGGDAVRANHTLSLLALKPGLFTGHGRDHSGRVWFDTLGCAIDDTPPTAWLGGPPSDTPRRHGQHKGSFGDVFVIGGAPGMGGAALLAARAALTAGAGRVYLARLDGENHAIDAERPELMPRSAADLLSPRLLNAATVVCGCGGGQPVRNVLPALLRHAGRLVLDADALNALAADPPLFLALAARGRARRPTVLTPHPLEAARLLDLRTADVQADRLAAAGLLAARSGATVLLKGSGSVVTANGRLPVINPTGNARLASAGTGDVLAGWLGGTWSQLPWPNDAVTAPDDGFDSACASAWLHGRAAEDGAPDAILRLPLRAADLIERMAAATNASAG